MAKKKKDNDLQNSTQKAEDYNHHEPHKYMGVNSGAPLG